MTQFLPENRNYRIAEQRGKRERERERRRFESPDLIKPLIQRSLGNWSGKKKRGGSCGSQLFLVSHPTHAWHRVVVARLGSRGHALALSQLGTCVLRVSSLYVFSFACVRCTKHHHSGGASATTYTKRETLLPTLETSTFYAVRREKSLLRVVKRVNSMLSRWITMVNRCTWISKGLNIRGSIGFGECHFSRLLLRLGIREKNCESFCREMVLITCLLL